MSEKISVILNIAGAGEKNSPSQTVLHDSLVWCFSGENTEEVYFGVWLEPYDTEVRFCWSPLEDGGPNEFVEWELVYMWNHQLSDPEVLTSRSTESVEYNKIYYTNLGRIKSNPDPSTMWYSRNLLRCILRRVGDRDSLPCGVIGLKVDFEKVGAEEPPTQSLKFDDEGGTFSYPTREETEDIVMGVGGTDQINIKPAGEVKRVFLEGVVTDPGFDFRHGCVMNGEREVLHETLSDLEGKKVRIMIEVVEDDDGL